MTRFAAHCRVFFVEEPFEAAKDSHLQISVDPSGVVVVTPHIRKGADREASLRSLINHLLETEGVDAYDLWYYTPMAISWTSHMKPRVVVYDCMDELSGFKNAPSDLRQREQKLLKRADLVFTGGQSLYEAKREQHRNIYPFPSSVDVLHFAQARTPMADPDDQKDIPRPRIGFFGVIDERMDLELVAAIADARPEWQVVMLGPVVKIDPAALPVRPNIHYLGMKTYAMLPQYLAGWDAAILPFARNESTRFISPTKLLEYLAAGRPVVSTSIRDVVKPYGECGVVSVADEPEEFVRAIEKEMQLDRESRQHEINTLLSRTSWNHTWGRMRELIENSVQKKEWLTQETGKRPLSRAAGAGAGRTAPLRWSHV